jgi:acyl carrier protein
MLQARLYGQSYLISSSWEDAIQELEDASKAFVRADGLPTVAQAACWIDLAEVYYGQAKESSKQTATAKYLDAIKFFKKGLQMYEESGMVKSFSTALSKLAQLYMSMEDYGEAYNKASGAADACRKTMDATGELAAFVVMLQAALQVATLSNNKVARKGVLEPALKAAAEAAKLSVKLGDKASEGVITFHHVQLAILNGRLTSEKAFKMCDDAIECFDAVGDLTSKGHVKLLVTQIHSLEDKFKQAEKSCREAYQIFLEADDDSGCQLAIQALMEMGVGSGGVMAATSAPAAIAAVPAQQKKAAAPAVEETVALRPTREGITSGIKAVAINHLEDDAVEMDTPLMDAGLDSLGAVSFRNELARKFEVTLPASLLFDFPTLSQIGDEIYSLI